MKPFIWPNISGSGHSGPACCRFITGIRVTIIILQLWYNTTYVIMNNLDLVLFIFWIQNISQKKQQHPNYAVFCKQTFQVSIWVNFVYIAEFIF